MPSAKQQPSNVKHGGAIRPNVWVLTFGPPCSSPIKVIVFINHVFHFVFITKIVTVSFISECCICDKLEIMNVGENIVYFHTEDNRLCTSAKTYLEMLRSSISPQLNLPEQTACICVDCRMPRYYKAEISAGNNTDWAIWNICFSCC